MTRDRHQRTWTRLAVLVGLLLAQLPASAFYNPVTGRWLSRDPRAEKGGPHLLAFNANAPIDSIDALGMQKGAEWLMVFCNTMTPCEDYKRARLADNAGWDESGGIVCCAGKKNACVWAGDKEKNLTARGIVERCIMEHERTHLDDVICPCSSSVTRPEMFKTGSRYYWEEMVAAATSLACFENALAECGDAQECRESIQGWIRSDSGSYSYYRSKYVELGGRF